jgi:hypothetical protein
MNANPSAPPIYGTYQSPEGRAFEMRSPKDVHDVFCALLKRMPQVVYDKRQPFKHFAFEGVRGQS